MKNLFYFLVLVLVAGCSQTLGYFPPEFADTGSGDAGTDTDTDTDAEADSGDDASSDAGESPCDAGACCLGGLIAPENFPCIADVLPENASEDFDPSLMLPYQFRCPNPDVCGGGEERRVGHTVCDGVSSSCTLDKIFWGAWGVTIMESSDPESACNPETTGGAILWLGAPLSAVSQYTCSGTEYAGCFEGKCLPAYTGEDCWANDSGFYCGGCETNCFEEGGNNCSPDLVCVCGWDGALCDEGFRCVYDYVVEDYTCIPE